MGLSRNKVAVSEGAAGSPPFYGDHDRFSRICRSRRMTRPESTESRVWNFCCSIYKDQGDLKVLTIFEKATLGTWGCSSAGRAPALQAGGHGFEPHHLHHPTVSGPKDRGRAARVAGQTPMGKIARERTTMERINTK